MRSVFYLCLLLIASSFSREVRAQKLVFEYDAAGNQTSREWVCINCSTSQMMAEASVIADTIEKASMDPLSEDIPNPFDEIRVVSVYPNPVSETLHVRWSSDLNIPIKAIYLNPTTGTLLLHTQIAPFQETMTIPFNSYPPGSYWLNAIFTDGRRESITIIKVD